ncbi:MAG TPA: hypothetical protein VHQ65_05730, partial [Thermoanaerobaculia bacterium]|nr:hypothetical protein [Thermoanaerobaculia bacterium]
APLGGGDLLALAAVAVYAAAAWTLHNATPDFIFHWGVKGRRYALAGGIDWGYLSDPTGLANNPEYPNLLPGFYAAIAHVAGGWVERPMVLVSVLLLALVWVFARQAAAGAAGGRLAAQAAVAAVVAAAAMFGIGYDMAGGADWLVLLALVMAAGPLLRPAAATGRADDLQLGLAAALAAGGKAEGVPLAAILLAVQALRVVRAGGELPGGRDDPSPRGAVRRRPGKVGLRRRRLAAFTACAAVPPALVVLPWLAAALRLDLFSLHDKTGSLDLARLPVVVPAFFETWGTPEWHGMTWLLVLLPGLCLVRRTRPLGAVLGLQLLVIAWVYLSAPLDPRFYVLSSFPRLAFHLLPVLMLGLVAAVAPPNPPPPDLKGHEP